MTKKRVKKFLELRGIKFRMFKKNDGYWDVRFKWGCELHGVRATNLLRVKRDCLESVSSQLMDEENAAYLDAYVGSG